MNYKSIGDTIIEENSVESLINGNKSPDIYDGLVNNDDG